MALVFFKQGPSLCLNGKNKHSERRTSFDNVNVYVARLRDRDVRYNNPEAVKSGLANHCVIEFYVLK